jgi:hypothetical protein
MHGDYFLLLDFKVTTRSVSVTWTLHHVFCDTRIVAKFADDRLA